MALSVYKRYISPRPHSLSLSRYIVLLVLRSFLIKTFERNAVFQRLVVLRTTMTLQTSPVAKSIRVFTRAHSSNTPISVARTPRHAISANDISMCGYTSLLPGTQSTVTSDVFPSVTDERWYLKKLGRVVSLHPEIIAVKNVPR